jgi:amidohydrolase
MASTDNFKITILGKGGHAAIPDEGVDAILMSAHAITALQSLIGKETSPLRPLVVHVGTIRGGNAVNITADRVELAGTVRTLDDRLRQSIPQQMTRILDGIIPAFRGTYEFEYEEGYPVVVNDETMTALARETAEMVVGRENVRKIEPGMISEDMAYFFQQVPGCYFYVGAGGRGESLHAPHHNARFDFDEDAMMIGAEIMTRATLAYLERE